MHDPFPLSRPERLVPYIEPFAEYFSLKTLPLHFHEVLFAFTLYHVTHKYLSPIFSRAVFPRQYPFFNARTKLNWDVHVTSFVQSTLICTLALWVMWSDEERKDMNGVAKVHGYTGASGLIQAFAGGYFLWDFVITIQNVSIFGVGMLAHAISALFVFSLGFRPFVNYYAPTFILYELSSPFLNIHWFCDKLNMTGSNVQLYNGIVLLCTFFSCRLIWGTWQSVQCFSDVYHALSSGKITLNEPEFGALKNGTMLPPELIPQSEIMQFAGDRSVPAWLAGCYLASNLTLNSLNWFWFGKMIETIRKRFDPPYGTRKPEIKEPTKEQVLVEGIDVDTPPPSRSGSPYVESGGGGTDYVGAVKLEKTGTHIEAEHLEVRNRSRAKRRG